MSKFSTRPSPVFLKIGMIRKIYLDTGIPRAFFAFYLSENTLNVFFGLGDEEPRMSKPNNKRLAMLVTMFVTLGF
jgi:uncharacterized membrane protein